MRDCRELILILVVAGGLFTAGASILKHMSAKDKQVMCASHLKEVAQMGFAYQNDHDGYFQPMIVRKRTWEYWPKYIKQYAKDFIHFSCPADELRGAGAFEVDELLPRFYNAGFISYGMNYYLSDSGEKHMKNCPCNIKKMVNPSYIVYFGDSRTRQLRPTSCWNMDHYPVHENNSANYVMLDGHVENHSQKTLGLVAPIKGWKHDRARWLNWAK
ncbi:MAG: hypothetical protein IKB74_05260 [Lentisphaeria bacterium]|nr:hypothetical protein [Lentisphaeria bacterium]